MQAVNSASKAQSIWRDVDRNTFRQHAVALRKYAAEIAGDEVVHSANDWQVRNNADGSATLLLPFDVEQRIADDLAFIAAAEDNLRVVSAVALEQYIEPRNLAIRLAANEVVPGGVPGTFEAIFELLSRCARKSALKCFTIF